MKRHLLLLFVLSCLIFACKKNLKPIDYVNPFIGTGGHGHTFPGATSPFGMVQLSPDTRLEGWDGCSGYHYSDSIIYGFSHTHLSGTGVGDYCDILFMPISGKVSINNGYKTKGGYKSLFKKESEIAKAGFYGVHLDKYNIDVELTAGPRTGVHKYQYNKKEAKSLIIDLAHRDRVIESSLKIINDSTICGYRRSQAWAKDQRIYFYARFSQKFSADLYKNEKLQTNIKKLKGTNLKALLKFKGEENVIIAKVALSAVDIKGAKKNFIAELENKSFDEVLIATQNKWNKELSKIKVEGGREDQKEIFYTSLYHTMIAPNLFSDVDGRYRGMDGAIYKNEYNKTYTIFSLWDTYRATHPLYTLIDRKRTSEFISTFVSQYNSGGILPIWELAANYTGCMIGYHAIPVIADAFAKGIYTHDQGKILEMMMHSANQDHLGLKAYKNLGYIPISEDAESISKTLEYAYDDWCIANTAKLMGNKKVYNQFIKRAQAYKNIYDPETGFMRPKLNETWKFPFDPKEVDFNFTEANSWQYSFYVPHDVNTLIEMHGGNKKFAKKLDDLFSAESKTTGRHQSDITGLIGQYAHGNEPSHHIAYLYNYVGQPWNTQDLVRKIMCELYTNKPDGLCGNEDCGQMSAWYVMSAMGFYPVNPANGEYILGSPIFNKITLSLENGKEFVISSNATKTKRYIKNLSLNKNKYSKSYITHDILNNGGTLDFELWDAPTKFGVKKEDRPYSKIKSRTISPLPYLVNDGRTFKRKRKIKIKCNDSSQELYYTKRKFKDWRKYPKSIKGFTKYKGEFYIDQSTNLYFATKKNKKVGKILKARFYKLPANTSIKLKHKWHKQYSAGGTHALIDGIKGKANFRTGDWQGFYVNDLHATITFKKKKRISYLSTRFIQDARSWIFMPTEVEFYGSTNGKNFKLLAKVKNTLKDTVQDVTIKNFRKYIRRRYYKSIKVVGKNPKVCPEWHPGAGLGAFVFADEITFR